MPAYAACADITKRKFNCWLEKDDNAVQITRWQRRAKCICCLWLLFLVQHSACPIYWVKKFRQVLFRGQVEICQSVPANAGNFIFMLHIFISQLISHTPCFLWCIWCVYATSWWHLSSAWVDYPQFHSQHDRVYWSSPWLPKKPLW